MINFLVILLLIINIIKSYKNNEDNIRLRIIDKFSYIKCSEDNKILSIYLGNELIYINFDKSNIVQFNNQNISFYYKNNTDYINITYEINNTIIYYNNDTEFIFMNDINKTKVYLKNGENIIINSIELYGTSNSFYILSADNEYFFIKYYIFSHALFAFGCFIILYGAFHFRLGLIIHILFLAYFLIGDIISFFVVFELYISFFLFFCVLLGVSVTIFLNPNNENPIKLRIINLIYSITFSYNIFKTAIFYYIFFEFPVGFANKNVRVILYFVFLMIFILIGIILSYPERFKNYGYISCSAVSGSFYIIKSLQYIVGSYFSSILFIKEDLKFVNVEKETLFHYSLTFFIIQISTIIFSIIFQIKYISFKKIEEPEPELELMNDSILPTRVSDLSSTFNPTLKEEEIHKKSTYNSVSSSIENEENEINDQDD